MKTNPPHVTKSILIFICGFVCTRATAQEKIFLYPSSLKVTVDGFDKDKEPPFIQYFKASPDSASGSAVLICPGGAYTVLADKHEGSDVAKFLNVHGFNAFVLHYRLNNA